jgi:hypothetical protein
MGVSPQCLAHRLVLVYVCRVDFWLELEEPQLTPWPVPPSAMEGICVLSTVGHQAQWCMSH